ncbi:MAG: hypothetical protein ACE5I7_20185, partial [Candidatus Binatia bacterium]
MSLLVVGFLAPSSVWPQSPPTGIITTVVGGGNGDGGPAGDALIDPRELVVAPVGGGPPDLYIVDGLNNRVRHVSGASGLIETIAGTGDAGFGGDNGPATQALLSFPLDVAVDGAGNVYIADTFNNRVRRVDPQGWITTFAGGGSGGDGGPAAGAALGRPYGVAVDSAGNVYI